ncbi:MAG: IPT/TIG domain-containing protein [Acidobacteria bacterium]|nr:IPT/TIG domain-containing protein [Acidobacteriota bacterium]
MSQLGFRSLLRLALCLLVPVLAAACGSDSPSGPSSSSVKVTTVSPSTGSTTGGNTVTITGAGFGSDTTVTIGGVSATNVVVSGTSTVTATTAARPTPGAADVSVTSGGKTSTLSGGFTFVAPSGANRPPAITAFRSIGSRNNQPSGFADIDETVQVVASVADSETSPSSLEYAWSGPGTLTPSGSTLTWKVPSSFAGGTPATATIGLTVTEKFTESGVQHQQSTSGSFPVRVHDSQKEIMDAGEDFLLLFSDSSKTTDQVLHNFSTTCDNGKGRTNEASDTDQNRRLFIQNFAAARVARRPPVTFNFVRGGCFPSGRQQPNTDACSAYTVHWEVTYKSDGRRETADGIDYVSAVFENDRWLLCHSDFIGSVTNPLTGAVRALTW